MRHHRLPPKLLPVKVERYALTSHHDKIVFLMGPAAPDRLQGHSGVLGRPPNLTNAKSRKGSEASGFLVSKKAQPYRKENCSWYRAHRGRCRNRGCAEVGLGRNLSPKRQGCWKSGTVSEAPERPLEIRLLAKGLGGEFGLQGLGYSFCKAQYSSRAELLQLPGLSWVLQYPGCRKAGKRVASTCAIDVEGLKRRPPSNDGEFRVWGFRVRGLVCSRCRNYFELLL